MLFLGDSLTHGSRDPYGLCWPFYMAHLAGNEGYTIIPELDAVPGRISGELVRVGVERITRTEAHEVFILIGTNDAKDEIATPPDLYLYNVRLLINTCFAFGKRPYVLTIPIPDGFGSSGYSTSVMQRIASYNQALRNNVELLVECESVVGSEDGIHFTPKMNWKVAQKTWQTIKNVRSFTSPVG
ncbi:MAG TPA: SGNH/GDSL hydrolase family protein [Anaerolineales bacterium]|nr:SGNH/GDSL hydrolase family protein [Anaerolineales bacterium]